MKTHDHAVAAGHSVDVDRWQREYDQLMGRIAPRFARVEPRRRVGVMVRGLLGELPRINCWTVAEQAGQPNPYGLQHLLSRAVWDHDGVREDLRGYVVERLGDPGAVLVLDETGDLKKGTATVGVQRPIHRHRRADRECAGRRLPDLRHRGRARVHRPRAVSAQVVDR